ncbi:MAG TPA: MATE family efflux transporter [Stellaceae bacterium]|nr:MATE family efflux transporter [Stellaceae bacterium]
MSSSVLDGRASHETWASELRAMLALAAPLVLTNLSQIALATTDVIMMGWLGPDTLAAGALGVNLNFAFQIFGMGLVTATSPLIAIELGAHRHAVREVRRTVHQGIWVAVSVALPVWFVLWHAEWILGWLGQKPELAHNSARYLHTFQWSFLPFLIYLVLRNFVAALQRPLSALWISAAGIVVNATLVYVLMFGKLGLPALGLPGAGISTTVTNIVMVLGLLGIIASDRRFRRYRLLGRLWEADWPRFREIWKIGLPIAFTMAFEVTVFNAAVFLMGILGADSLAAHSIAIQIASVVFMVPLGLGNAATVRVGLAYGAGDRRRIGRAGWTAFVLGLGYACCTAAIILTSRRQLVGLFLDLDSAANQPVIALAVSFLLYAGIFQLADAGQAVSSGMLRGLGDTRVPMLIAALGYWCVGLPVGAALAFWTPLAGRGIWIGLASGLATVALLMTTRWIMRERLGLTRADESLGAVSPAIHAVT